MFCHFVASVSIQRRSVMGSPGGVPGNILLRRIYKRFPLCGPGHYLESVFGSYRGAKEKHSFLWADFNSKDEGVIEENMMYPEP